MSRRAFLFFPSFSTPEVPRTGMPELGSQAQTKAPPPCGRAAAHAWSPFSPGDLFSPLATILPRSLPARLEAKARLVPAPAAYRSIFVSVLMAGDFPFGNMLCMASRATGLRVDLTWSVPEDV
jgi:hypothetical protein